jgi:hypothetical protein
VPLGQLGHHQGVHPLVGGHGRARLGVGVVVAGGLGLVLNDSGIAVPGVIASVVNAVLVVLLATVWSEREVTHAR